MRIGVSAFAWTSRLSRSHFPILKSLREHGVTAFEIPMFDPGAIDVAPLRRALEEGDLECTVCAILPPGINPISSDAADRKAALAHLIRCIETSAELGGRLIGGPVYAPIGYLPQRRRTEDEWKWAVDCFQGLGESLDAYRMTLCVEPVNRAETFFLRTATEARDLCDAVGHPRIGITIDTFHANIEEKSIAGAVLAAGNRLRHVHASENDRGLLGSGHVDFSAILTALGAIGYDGCLMIEGFGYSPENPDALGTIWGDPQVSPEDIAFQGAKYLIGLLSRHKSS